MAGRKSKGHTEGILQAIIRITIFFTTKPSDGVMISTAIPRLNDDIQAVFLGKFCDVFRDNGSGNCTDETPLIATLPHLYLIYLN